jgi:ABC-2 type transport system ATP-binding protein
MIEVSNMSKYYADYPAVLDVSFSIKAGETVGLLGPNGAGKSTTMKVLTGFTPPTDGNVSIGGFDIIKNSFEARKLLGYLPENVPLYLDMTVTEYLVFMAKIRGMNESVNKRVNEVIEITSLGDYKDTLIGKLSKGYRQRTGISQAIIHNPKVLILDEPTIGIDPVQVVETRNLIKSLEGEHTLILSSHILPEVTSICKRILVIHEGKIVADDTPDNLSKRLQSTNVCEIEVSGSNKLDIIKLFRKESYIIDIRSKPSTNSSYNTFIIETSSSESVEQKIAKLVVENSLGLRKLIPLSLSLEEIFLQLTSD